MTDMADVESVSEPSNNGKVLRLSQYSQELFNIYVIIKSDRFDKVLLLYK